LRSQFVFTKRAFGTHETGFQKNETGFRENETAFREPEISLVFSKERKGD
jgi:hypothetical protein